MLDISWVICKQEPKVIMHRCHDILKNKKKTFLTLFRKLKKVENVCAQVQRHRNAVKTEALLGNNMSPAEKKTLLVHGFFLQKIELFK